MYRTSLKWRGRREKKKYRERRAGRGRKPEDKNRGKMKKIYKRRKAGRRKKNGGKNGERKAEEEK